MIFATCVAGFGSAWGLLSKGIIGYVALGALGVMLLLGVLGFFKKQAEHANSEAS